MIDPRSTSDYVKWFLQSFFEKDIASINEIDAVIEKMNEMNRGGAISSSGYPTNIALDLQDEGLCEIKVVLTDEGKKEVQKLKEWTFADKDKKRKMEKQWDKEYEEKRKQESDKLKEMWRSQKY